MKKKCPVQNSREDELFVGVKMLFTGYLVVPFVSEHSEVAKPRASTLRTLVFELTIPKNGSMVYELS